jgi:CheY-like chemotaxis protein
MTKALGGRLYLCDEFIGGSRFVIELPGGITDAPTIPIAIDTIDSEAKFPAMLRVLLVDDSIASNKLLERRFKSLSSNIDVTSAVNGEAALLLCEDEAVKGFDVIVIDQNMHSTGGILLGHEVVLILRTKFKLNRTVLYGCSGNASTVSKDFMANGANGVWSKPTPSTPVMIASINHIRGELMGIASRLPCGVRVALIDDSTIDSKILIRRVSK